MVSPRPFLVGYPLSMKIDLHNHTIWCHHADGSMDEFIHRAVAAGIDVFGFADHAPMSYDPEHRMIPAEAPIYEQTVRDFAAKMAGTLEILLGYEVDFLPGYMLDSVLQGNVDYLIGSVHFLQDWGFDNPRFIDGFRERDIDTVWRDYFDAVRRMAESKLFDIVGHLDLIKIFRFLPSGDIPKIAEPALEAIRRSGMAVEINASGLRKPIAEPYPGLNLLKACNALGIPITFGSDAHHPDHVGFMRTQIEAIARQAGYTQCAVYHGRQKTLVPF